MLGFDDSDHDGHLNLNEFYAAFSKLYSKALDDDDDVKSALLEHLICMSFPPAPCVAKGKVSGFSFRVGTCCLGTFPACQMTRPPKGRNMNLSFFSLASYKAFSFKNSMRKQNTKKDVHQ